MNRPKIIIWGWPLYSHSHSFINHGFYRAFQYLGYETFWFRGDEDVSNWTFKNCIFFVEGQCVEKLPRIKEARYILHNCSRVDEIGKFVNIQYLTYDSLKFEQISHGITHKDDCIYFPWGSPLLPDEFDEWNVESPRGENIYYLGTVNGPNDNGNYQNILKFAITADADGHPMHVGGGYTGATDTLYLKYMKGWISESDQIHYLSKAFMAPAIQGPNTLANGMIPCRIFKAISYGNDGITNNPMAHEFFNGLTIYNDDCEQLYWDAKEHADETQRKHELFDFVKEKHTYINNINAILSVL